RPRQCAPRPRPFRRGARRRSAAGAAGLPRAYLARALTADLGRKVFAVGFQPGEELGHNARPPKRPEDIALLVDAGLVEETDVLQLNLVAVDAGDLGDMGYDAAPVAQPGLLYQQSNAANDL